MIWGLTGGIAAGKSAAAQFFSEAGIPVIDADQVAREVSAPGGAAFPLIQKRFGNLDRAALRDLVFSDPQAKQDLEAILHPIIRQESLQRIKRMQAQPTSPAIYEAALLIETGRYQDFDGLIVVTAPIEDRKKRLAERNGFSPELIEKIMRSQSTDEEKIKLATHVLTNNGSLADLKNQVQDLLPRLRVLN